MANFGKKPKPTTRVVVKVQELVGGKYTRSFNASIHGHSFEAVRAVVDKELEASFGVLEEEEKDHG